MSSVGTVASAELSVVGARHLQEESEDSRGSDSVECVCRWNHGCLAFGDSYRVGQVWGLESSPQV